MHNDKHDKNSFEIDFSKFDKELTGLLLQITENYKKNQKPTTKKTHVSQKNKSTKKTKKRKIVKLDLKKIKDAIEQSVAMAKKNNEDAK